jgi:Fe-S cluster assembly ATPase SufC
MRLMKKQNFLKCVLLYWIDATMPGKQTLKATILGVTGSGKTTLALEIIGQYDRVLIMDSMGEYDTIKDAIVCEGADECISKQAKSTAN